MTLEALSSVNPVEIPMELNRKIEQATKNLFPGYRRHLGNVSALNAENAATICDYIAALKVEVKPSDHYRKDLINILTMLAKRIGNQKFKNLARQDIILFLQSFEKTEEMDLLHNG